MYNSYYGLTFYPFDKQQLKEKDHFISRDFTEMTGRLDYLKDIRGIGVFTARPGMGKTYALRCFASSLNPNLYHIEYLCLSTISVADFYKQLCSILGVPDRGGKTACSVQSRIRSHTFTRKSISPCFSPSMKLACGLLTTRRSSAFGTGCHDNKSTTYYSSKEHRVIFSI